MPYFHTGIIIQPNDIEVIEDIAGPFSFILIEDPTKRHWANELGQQCLTNMCWELRNEEQINRDKLSPCFELLIQAKDIDEADNALSLVRAGMYLAYPENINVKGLQEPIEDSPEYSKIKEIKFIWERYYFDHRADVGCFTLNKAWENTSYVYSLEKYKYSVELDSITPHSGAPRHGQIFENESSLHSSHVNSLMSIISAFSAIEELGDEIRASSQKPRFLKNGDWNPKVWDDTCQRLQHLGVDVNREFNWILRGTPTAIHVEFEDSFGKPSEENDGEIVRDRNLHIVEALHWAGYLRNCVAAHKFNSKSKAVSPYDTHNVQSLARIILMQSLGVWEYVINKNTMLTNPSTRTR